MPKPNRPRISQPQWDIHKDTIKRLYLSENKNLEGHGGVIELMRQEDLHASKPQYETQFRRWGFRKKLTREAWHTIGHIIERRNNEGKLSCVYAYGTRLPSEKVKKETARHRLCTAGEQSCTRDMLPDGIIIQQDSVDVADPTTSLIPRGIGSDSVSRRPGLLPSERIEWPQRATSAADFRLGFDLQLTSSSFTELLLSGSVAGEASNSAHTPDFLALLPSALPSPSSQFAHDADFIMTRRASSVWPTMEYHIPVNTTSLFDTLDHSLVRGFRPLVSSVQNHIISTSGQMRHLLPSKASQELQRASADIVIVKQIMFLLMNNFAGSDYAAFDTIFEQVKRFSVSQMEDILNAIPEPYTSALQQSILTIAIKSNIPSIVEILMRRDLDPNRVTCRFGGKVFMPLGLACNFNRLEVVKTLIRYGADPNYTISHELAVATSILLQLDSRTVGFPPDTCAILQCLLVAHARMRHHELGRRHFWTNETLVDVYIRYSKYPTDFPGIVPLCHILRTVLTFCSPEKSTAAMKVMLGNECIPIAPKDRHPTKDMQDTLAYASYQGNSDVVNYFLELGIEPDAQCLIEAVRGNNEVLVQKYIRAGIHVHSQYLLYATRRCNTGTFSQEVEPQLQEGYSIFSGPTTPFAEAVRLSRQHLSQDFQSSNLPVSKMTIPSIEAVAMSAAQTGNKDLIRRLFGSTKGILSIRPDAGSCCITMSMLENREDIVEIFLQAGFLPNSDSVLSAILVRNVRLTNLFLDWPFFISQRDMAVYFAVRWGNLAVLEKLIAAGFLTSEYRMRGSEDMELRLNSIPEGSCLSPFGEALRIGNPLILQLLLENVAPPRPSVPIGTKSPLTTAISSGNELIVRELLARGAEPNDPDALQAAVSQSKEMAHLILGAFLQRRPPGGKDFFDSTLRQAIVQGDENTIRTLAKHADLNDTGWVKWGLEGQVHKDCVPMRNAIEEPEPLPTLLGEGIAMRSADVVSMLLDSGGDPNSIVQMPRQSGKLTAISKAISIGDLAMLRLLHRNGANLHFSATLRITHTSLQLAVELGHSDIVQYLLDQRVDVNAPPCVFEGGTALQFAAKTGSVGTAEVLLQHGANINAPGSRYRGKTAFEFAAEFGRMDMLLLLFHRGVDIVSDEGYRYREPASLRRKTGRLPPGLW